MVNRNRSAASSSVPSY